MTHLLKYWELFQNFRINKKYNDRKICFIMKVEHLAERTKTPEEPYSYRSSYFTIFLALLTRLQ